MKLHEFSVADDLNNPKEKILAMAENSAAEMSGFMSFANGYKVVEVGEPQKHASGEIHYSFDVHGEYDKSIPDDSSDNEAHQKQIEVIAARQHRLKFSFFSRSVCCVWD